MSERKTVRMRRHSWLEDPQIEVDLVPTQGVDEWDVVYQNAAIGTVSSYIGSIKINYAGSRIRRATKTRKLWAYRTPRSNSSMWEVESRAEAIRALIQRSELRR
jgi:hypothetical protein